MNVGQLKDSLQDIPDDTEIILVTGLDMQDWSVDFIYEEFRTYGIALPKNQQTTKRVLALHTMHI